MNFEDPFFIENNQVRIIEELLETFKEYYNPNLKYLFFDEIQNYPNWESFINKLHRRGHNIVLTGSNSQLLSRELGSALTGRHHLIAREKPLAKGVIFKIKVGK